MNETKRNVSQARNQIFYIFQKWKNLLALVADRFERSLRNLVGKMSQTHDQVIFHIIQGLLSCGCFIQQILTLHT